MASAFVFPLLDTKQSEIRLVKLRHRVNPEDSIRCELSTCELSTDQKFTALSYTWGVPSSNTILLNNQEFSIFDNLFNFLSLKSLDRAFCQETRLWIDQLCINQDDTHERNHQVDRMGSIYSSATNTIIWLGRPGKDNGLNNSQCMAIANHIRSPLSTTEPSLAAIKYLQFKNGQSSHSLKFWKDFHEYPIFSLALLGSCEYWTRLWVIQEVLLSHSLTIHFDSEIVEWKDLEIFRDSCWGYLMAARKSLGGSSSDAKVAGSNNTGLIQRSIGMLHPLNRLVDLRWRANMGFIRVGQLLWGDLISMAREAECKLPHDKIFGLQGLVNPFVRVEVDYNKDAAQLCVEVLLAEIGADPRCGPVPKHELSRLQANYRGIAVDFAIGLKIYHDEFLRQCLKDVVHQVLRQRVVD